MDQRTEREIAAQYIARVVANAAEPDSAGKRMSGDDLKKLAEDAAEAISAGMVKLSGGGAALSQDGAGEVEGNEQHATWEIDVQQDGVHLRRMHNGMPCESYRVVSPAVAAIWVAAIIQGYQPPRDLRRLDKPVG